MKGSTLQYVVGAISITYSIYQVYIKNVWEFALYVTAGAAFISVGLIKDKVFAEHHRLMSIISWVLVLLTAFLFFFMVRTDT